MQQPQRAKPAAMQDRVGEVLGAGPGLSTLDRKVGACMCKGANRVD